MLPPPVAGWALAAPPLAPPYGAVVAAASVASEAAFTNCMEGISRGMELRKLFVAVAPVADAAAPAAAAAAPAPDGGKLLFVVVVVAVAFALELELTVATVPADDADIAAAAAAAADAWRLASSCLRC